MYTDQNRQGDQRIPAINHYILPILHALIFSLQWCGGNFPLPHGVGLSIADLHIAFSLLFQTDDYIVIHPKQ